MLIVGAAAGAITAALGLWDYSMTVRDLSQHAPALLSSDGLRVEADRWRYLAATMFVAAAICNAIFEGIHRRGMTLVSLLLAISVPLLAAFVSIAVVHAPKSNDIHKTGWVNQPPLIARCAWLIAGAPSLVLGARLRKYSRDRAG